MIYKITTIEKLDNHKTKLEEDMFSILRKMMDLEQQVRAGEMARIELEKCRQKLIELALEYGRE